MPDRPLRLLLGTRSGVLALRLTDSGWDTGAVLWPDRPISAVAVDPAVADRIHVSVYEDGIYRSEDGGRTWERYLWAELHALAIRPDRPELVYAGAEPAEVYRSTDSGSYWTAMQLTTHPGGLQGPREAWRRVRSLAFDPTNVAVVYAGVEGGGIVATFDGGRDWTELAARGLPADVQTLVVRRDAPETLWAGTSAGLFRSDDRGFDWADAGVGIDGPNVLALVEHGDALLAASHPQALEGWWDRHPARIYRFGKDAARWWQVAGPLDGAVYAFALSPDGAVAFAGTTGGSVLRSADGGTTWAVMARGLPPIRAMAVA